MKNKYFLTMLFLCASIGLIAQTTVWKSEVEGNWVQPAPGDTAFWTNGTPTMFAGSKAVLNVPTMGDCHVVSDTASCKQLVAGDNSPMGGKLIIKDGGVLTVGVDNDSWTGVAYNNSGWMVVEAGGTVISNQRMHVGMLAAKADTCVAILEIAGTVNVTKNIFSIDNNGWTGQPATVTVSEGGVLMAPNFRMGTNSKMDVAGGLVIIKGVRDSTLNAYKTDGRLTGEGGFEPPTITVYPNATSPNYRDTVTVISTSTSPEYEEPPRTTVVDIIVNSPDHTTLETAVIAAELADDLAGDGPFTVFAPTDAAFAALPDGVLDKLLADPTGALANVLLYHVVNAKAMSGDLTDGQVIATLEGTDVTVTLADGKVLINTAEVTVADLEADNGVVHVINAVLTYEGLSVNEKAKATFSIFPNPATDMINLSERADVKIYSITGQLVMSMQDVSQVNVETLKSGLYFVEATSNGQRFLDKLLVN
jgi:uncharacterized surface protein with fasciclin (FAS1) repeats